MKEMLTLENLYLQTLLLIFHEVYSTFDIDLSEKVDCKNGIRDCLALNPMSGPSDLVLAIVACTLFRFSFTDWLFCNRPSKN